MKLGVVIGRSTYYRHLGPIVDAALARGWDVTCWHYEGGPASGAKAYQRPSASPPPSYANGSPGIQDFTAFEELPSLVAGVDGVISLHGPSIYNVSSAVPWGTVQHGVDFFRYGDDNLLSGDLNCVYSDFWLDWYGQHLERANGRVLSPELKSQLQAKSVATGFVELDVLRRIDPVKVRRKWRIPVDQPVVTYLPSSPCAHQRMTPWCRCIYSPPSRLRQLWSILLHPRCLQYLPHVSRGWNDAAVVKAIRRFCDHNQAFLIVKSRRKTPANAYEKAAADKLLYDESHYPPTFLEVLAISDLIVGYHSTTVTESVYAGVPYLLITLPNPESVPDPAFLATLETGEEPVFWRCKGIIWRLELDELLSNLPGMKLGDFQVQPEMRERYVRKLLGFDDGQSAERVLDAIRAFRQL